MSANSPILLNVLKCIKLILDAVIDLLQKGVNN